VVALAALENVAVESKTAVRVQLRISRAIKGQAAPPTLTATLVLSPQMAARELREQDLMPKTRAEAIGLWFLSEKEGAFQVLPLASGNFIIWDEVFLPLPIYDLRDPAAVIPGLTPLGDGVRQTVLAALVESFLSSPSPRGTLRAIVTVSLNQEDRQDSLAAADVLIASASPEHQILGLEAALRLGSDEVLPLLARKVEALRPHRMFPGVLFALGTEYKPNGEASVAPLLQLTSMHLGTADFDAAVASALRKIGTRAIVPAMVELLDSPDQTAQLHAAHFLSEYALFADANGDLSPIKPGGGRPVGPWGTDATQANMPSRDSTRTPQEYAAFWKAWWAENKARLGFTGP